MIKTGCACTPNIWRIIIKFRRNLYPIIPFITRSITLLILTEMCFKNLIAKLGYALISQKKSARGTECEGRNCCLCWLIREKAVVNSVCHCQAPTSSGNIITNYTIQLMNTHSRNRWGWWWDDGWNVGKLESKLKFIPSLTTQMPWWIIIKSPPSTTSPKWGILNPTQILNLFSTFIL